MDAINNNNKCFPSNISYLSYTVLTIFPVNKGYPTHDHV